MFSNSVEDLNNRLDQWNEKLKAHGKVFGIWISFQKRRNIKKLNKFARI